MHAGSQQRHVPCALLNSAAAHAPSCSCCPAASSRARSAHSDHLGCMPCSLCSEDAPCTAQRGRGASRPLNRKRGGSPGEHMAVPMLVAAAVSKLSTRWAQGQGSGRFSSSTQPPATPCQPPATPSTQPPATGAAAGRTLAHFPAAVRYTGRSSSTEGSSCDVTAAHRLQAPAVGPQTAHSGSLHGPHCLPPGRGRQPTAHSMLPFGKKEVQSSTVRWAEGAGRRGDGGQVQRCGHLDRRGSKAEMLST